MSEERARTPVALTAVRPSAAGCERKLLSEDHAHEAERRKSENYGKPNINPTFFDLEHSNTAVTANPAREASCARKMCGLAEPCVQPEQGRARCVRKPQQFLSRQKKEDPSG